ncbi:MAG: crotonase/enoyl-CoA hydratase family protein [Woeseiaceae bacterium]|nr:crotonase/enoyl-CoA hydratase family protein [Woeseiaceae bacterium]
MSDVVDVTVTNRVAEVRLNRPDKRNALNIELFDALGRVGRQLADNPAVRAVVLAGNGEHFCAGIDTGLFAGGLDDSFAERMRPVPPSPANSFQAAAYVWRELPVPVICALHGVAFGGGLQIAMGADLRYAAPDARLSVMEIRWGIVPDMAITSTLRHVVAVDQLLELALTGRVIDAHEALGRGLVTAVHEDPLAAARETASQIAAHSPDAVRAIKRLILDGFRQSDADALALEAGLQLQLIGSPNQVEAVRANLEQRAPTFRD